LYIIRIDRNLLRSRVKHVRVLDIILKRFKTTHISLRNI